MRFQRLTLALAFLLAADTGMATLIQTRQVLTFDLPSVQYIHYAPVTLPITPDIQTLTLSFDGFDSSLGTLKNAYLSYEGTYAIQYFVKAGTRTPKWYESIVYGGYVAGYAQYSYAFGITVPGVSGLLSATLHEDAMSTQAQGYRYSGLSYIDFDGSGPKDPKGDFTIDGKYLWRPWVIAGDLDTPVLSLANGLDVAETTIDVIVKKEMTMLMFPFFSAFVDPDYSFVQNDLNAWSGKMAMTYEYETLAPEPIPEPSTLLLCCAGLIGFAWRAGMNQRCSHP